MLPYSYKINLLGGIIFDDTNDIFADQIAQQAIVALNEANAGVLVCDGLFVCIMVGCVTVVGACVVEFVYYIKLMI